jgi:hypothetical protein
MGWTRSFYWLMGWSYDHPRWDEKQRRQKYLVIKQIEQSKVIKLKSKKSKTVRFKTKKIKKNKR